MKTKRADFYIVNQSEDKAHWILICRLLEKAYLCGNQVFVLCNHQQDAEFLDELLWTFKEDSFIPHHLQGEGPTPPPPIQIGYSEPKGFSDILMNLSASVPAFYTRFNRIIQVVPNQDEPKTISREHFKFYKSQAVEMFTHHL